MERSMYKTSTAKKEKLACPVKAESCKMHRPIIQTGNCIEATAERENGQSDSETLSQRDDTLLIERN
jgi:hypothetical protein